MSNSEGYREDLGASQARNAELEKELDELRKLKAPDIRSYRESRKNIRNLTILATLIVLLLGACVWWAVDSGRTQAERHMQEIRGRTDAFQVEHEALRARHRRLVRLVEQQQALAQPHDTSPLPVIDTSAGSAVQRREPAPRPSSQEVASRLVLCQAANPSHTRFVYVEGVVVSRALNARTQPVSTRRDELEPVTLQQIITLLLPDRSEINIHRSLCLRDGCHPSSANSVFTSPTNPSGLSESDVWEEIFWAELRVGDIIGLTLDNPTDRNVVAVRTTGK